MNIEIGVTAVVLSEGDYTYTVPLTRWRYGTNPDGSYDMAVLTSPSQPPDAGKGPECSIAVALPGDATVQRLHVAVRRAWGAKLPDALAAVLKLVAGRGGTWLLDDAGEGASPPAIPPRPATGRDATGSVVTPPDEPYLSAASDAALMGEIARRMEARATDVSEVLTFGTAMPPGTVEPLA